MMNVPYFISKELFVMGKQLDQKVISKLMTWQTGTQTIAINNISQKVKTIEAYLRLLIYKRNRRGTLT